MKIKTFLGFIAVTVAGLTIAGVRAQAPSIAPVSAEGGEMTGTIKEYSAGKVLVLETITPDTRMQFKLAKNTAYAGIDGKPIEAGAVTPNHKARVHYTKTDADNVADKITLVADSPGR
jgi:hypothetical protein